MDYGFSLSISTLSQIHHLVQSAGCQDLKQAGVKLKYLLFLGTAPWPMNNLKMREKKILEFLKKFPNFGKTTCCGKWTHAGGQFSLSLSHSSPCCLFPPLSLLPFFLLCELVCVCVCVFECVIAAWRWLSEVNQDKMLQMNTFRPSRPHSH